MREALNWCIGRAEVIARSVLSVDAVAWAADNLGYAAGDGAAVAAAMLLPASIVVCILGRRVIPLLKIVVSGLLGYFLGCTLAPLLPALAELPREAVGAVTLVAFVLFSSPIYLISYALAFGGFGFVTIYSGAVIPALLESIPAAATAAVLLILLSLYCRCYVEALAVSLTGAFGICVSLCVLLPWLNQSSLMRLILISALTVLGLVRQIRSKRE